jgi:hypothetical protein
MVVFALWLFTGLFLDGAAHNRGAVDSFFTPWHLVLYSGFAASSGWIFLGWMRMIQKGYPVRKAIFVGYELSVVGATVFGVGGVLDLTWHTVFGIEKGFEALVSPSHLVLAVGLFLIMSGPFRAAWHRSDPEKASIGHYLPMLFSWTFTFSILTFFTMMLNPLGDDIPGSAWLLRASGSRNFATEAAFAMFLLQSALLAGTILMAVRRWQLPFGSVTLLLAINMLAMGFIADKFIYMPVAIITGLVADGLIAVYKPSIKRMVPLRILAFLVPALFYLIYFITLTMTQGMWWSVALWGGAVGLCGVTGLLLSYLLVPDLRMVQELIIKQDSE